MAKSKMEIQTIEQLTKRFKELDTEKTRVQTRLESARERLEELMIEAEQNFGTHSVEELETKLEQMENENQQKRMKYQQDLDGIEQRLAEIEERFVDLDENGDDE